MSAITTHVLDTARGRPAAGIHVDLEMRGDDSWWHIARAVTDADGRIRSLIADAVPLDAGVYRLTYETEQYFQASNRAAFYPRVIVEFSVTSGESHYHVPLLLSPFGYTTYRGT